VTSEKREREREREGRGREESGTGNRLSRGKLRKGKKQS